MRTRFLLVGLAASGLVGVVGCGGGGSSPSAGGAAGTAADAGGAAGSAAGGAAGNAAGGAAGNAAGGAAGSGAGGTAGNGGSGGSSGNGGSGGTPGCSTDADCAGNTAGTKCVNGNCECLQQSDCPAGKVCSPNHSCVACNTDSDCTGNPDGAACYGGQCGCRQGSDCPSGDSCAGNPLTGSFFKCQPLTCPAGYMDCDGFKFNGCEIHVDADPDNCGACGTSCNGGPCSHGKCGSPPELMTEDFDLFAVDDTNMYGIGVGLKSVNLASGTATTLVPDANIDYYRNIAIDANNIYYTSGPAYDPNAGQSTVSVYWLPKTGGTPAAIGTFTATADTTYPLQADGGFAYFQDPLLSALFRSPVPAGPRTQIASQTIFSVGPGALFLISSTSGTSDILSSPKAGGTTSVVVKGVARLCDFAADASYVYYTTDSPYSPSSPDVGSMYRVPVGGGTPELLTTYTNPDPTAPCLTNLRVGPNFVYAVQNAGPYSVIKVPKTGGPYVVLDQDPYWSTPFEGGSSVEDLEINSTRAYWSVADGYGYVGLYSVPL